MIYKHVDYIHIKYNLHKRKKNVAREKYCFYALGYKLDFSETSIIDRSIKKGHSRQFNTKPNYS